MRSENRLINIFLVCFCVYAMIACATCDDRIRQINAKGRIIVKDSCSKNDKAAWIVDLDMSQTFLPRGMSVTFREDTINGIRYSGLVRVFCHLQYPDSILFTKDFYFRMDPLQALCPSSSYNFSSYNADDAAYAE